MKRALPFSKAQWKCSIYLILWVQSTLFSLSYNFSFIHLCLITSLFDTALDSLQTANFSTRFNSGDYFKFLNLMNKERQISAERVSGNSPTVSQVLWICGERVGSDSFWPGTKYAAQSETTAMQPRSDCQAGCMEGWTLPRTQDTRVYSKRCYFRVINFSRWATGRSFQNTDKKSCLYFLRVGKFVLADLSA